jgi:hypothetical protein
VAPLSTNEVLSGGDFATNKSADFIETWMSFRGLNNNDKSSSRWRGAQESLVFDVTMRMLDASSLR